MNSPRGVVFSTPGSGFQVSANAASGTPVEFGNINATYPGLFTTFSAPRLFTALGSNIVDINFFIPGTNTPAFTTGFGSVFSDVDIANATTIQFFNLANASLGTFSVPNTSGNETLSFLGVLFNAGEQVGRVRITSGNSGAWTERVHDGPRGHGRLYLCRAQSHSRTGQSRADPARSAADHGLYAKPCTTRVIVPSDAATSLTLNA